MTELPDPVPDLMTDPRALAVRKKPLPVSVEFARSDGVCATLEGDVRFRAGDALLSGVQGERWPVQRGSFLQSYAPEPPTQAGEDGTYRKRPSTARALQLQEGLSVKVGWKADPLHGRPGDWLLRYADGSPGIVSDAIFRQTYDLL